jgi:hypothetical protein
MMREGPTEGELMRMMQDCLSKLEGCCRQLGHARGDYRWFKLGQIYAGLMEKNRALDKATGLRGTLILPENYRRPNWQ